MSGWDDDHYGDDTRPIGAWLWISVALWAIIFGGAWLIWLWLS